ncbi:hypothetical protein LZ554_009484 [Drepanopeziza brunnea f. sp. 'monogermtubi']|nr:hypothetical protein LZ554_009484 [Drepanopeziza brunnea f. sp. 'monogermtubi']
MSTAASILPTDNKSTTSSLSRTPLWPRSVTPTSPINNSLRRKGSFLRHDSSEEIPSSHDSIFEAYCLSGSEGSFHKAELIDIPGRIPRLILRNDENSRATSPSSVADTISFRYGNGTVLDTITEQKSVATLRSKNTKTKSADASPNVPFLTHRDSFIISKTPRRMVSFSLDDIELIKQSYHDACTKIEKEAFQPLLLEHIYAEPKTPIHAPPDRLPTPEGMPSWTEAQKRPIPPRRRPQPVKQNIFRKFLGMPGFPKKTSSQERDRTVSAPVRGRTAPRFRPPKSVYGPIDQHPFFSAPLARIDEPQPVSASGTHDPTSAIKPKSKRLRKEHKVRFATSATAQDSEFNILQAAVESTADVAPHPSQPFQSTITELSNKEPCTHRKTSGGSTRLRKPVPGHLLGAEYTLVPLPPSPELPRGVQPYLRPYPIGSPIDLTPICRVLPEPTTNSQLTQNELDSLCVLDSHLARSFSISSTSHLMSGALDAPSSPPLMIPLPTSHESPELKKEQAWCWRCSLQSALGKLDQWWLKSAGCMCFVCCGFDTDGDDRRGRKTIKNMAGEGEDVERARVVVMSQTPARVL